MWGEELVRGFNYSGSRGVTCREVIACQRGHSSYCPICNSSGEKKCSPNWVVTVLGGSGGGGGGEK